MKKLHVNTEKGFIPVFCHMNGKVITCKEKQKALPQKAIWADDDLKFFSEKFSNKEFRLI